MERTPSDQMGAAPDVAAADDDPDFHAERMYGLDVFRHLLRDLGRDRLVAARSAQRLAAELQKNPAEFRRGGLGGGLRHRDAQESESVSAWKGESGAS